MIPLAMLIATVLLANLVSANINGNGNTGHTEAQTEQNAQTVANQVQANAALEDYDVYCYPIVTNGIEVYDNTEKTDSKVLINACIWSLLRGDTQGEKYTVFDDAVLVPRNDVEKESARLFGKKVNIQHQSVETDGYIFSYDEKTGMYNIPITGITPEYLPEIIGVDQKNGEIILNVGCLKSSDYVQNKNGTTVQPEPEKYLNIYLKKTDGSYCITKVERQEN